jgi:diketogulonate reductase-like aldo/keto reductase
MLSIPLNDGSSIPWLGYGSSTALFDKPATEAVSQAIKAGFRHIDTA